MVCFFPVLPSACIVGFLDGNGGGSGNWVVRPRKFTIFGFLSVAPGSLSRKASLTFGMILVPLKSVPSFFGRGERFYNCSTLTSSDILVDFFSGWYGKGRLEIISFASPTSKIPCGALQLSTSRFQCTWF